MRSARSCAVCAVEMHHDVSTGAEWAREQPRVRSKYCVMRQSSGLACEGAQGAWEQCTVSPRVAVKLMLPTCIFTLARLLPTIPVAGNSIMGASVVMRSAGRQGLQCTTYLYCPVLISSLLESVVACALHTDVKVQTSLNSTMKQRWRRPLPCALYAYRVSPCSARRTFSLAPCCDMTGLEQSQWVSMFVHD